MPTFKKHPCPICGTVKYKKAAEGYYVCKYGHQMVGYQEEAGDDDAIIGVQMSARKKAVTTEQKESRLYGAELQDAVKRIHQYVLQVMSRAFVEQLSFPAEFEYVARELWLLYVNDSKVTLVDAYVKNGPTEQRPMNDNPDTLLEASDTDDDDDDNDTNNNDNDDNGHSTQYNKTKETKSVQWPPLFFRHALVFCYITCVYLGWPVMLNDIHRWCTTMRLPYLHILKEFPEASLRLVDLRYLTSMLQFPRLEDLERDTVKFTSAFVHRCGLELPKFNTSLLIHRFCTQLYLPVEFYFCAQTMYERYPYQHWSQTKDDGHVNEGYQVMVVILMLIKAAYGLDDQNRDCEYDNSDLAPPLPKGIWMEHIRANAERWEDIYRHKLIDSPDVDLDILVNYLKHSVTGERHEQKEKKSIVRRHILKMQEDLNLTHRLETYDDFLADIPRLSSTMDHSQHKKVIGNDYILHPKRYKAEGKFLYSEEYELVLRLASRMIGCDERDLHGRLIFYESRLYDMSS
ncbi:uncharacterized protein BX664DRAFT_362731 [Halteromyces radiatus]|uniref:uncharacterized protein n=1 Tax=Halteromyces radiatus TaxID=101107 RepID=UPI0022200469|nr:uncharacterized protein BX664DRAFT_362731 [Halteromyces radiatus]KAI8076806.1 hypothetical protein BX664DRAFT_362731 [Halteromyces radiatus]